MRPRFHPRLVNGPFEDPGLFIPFLFEKRALLFDLGDIHRLAPRDILKLTHVFVSHTHMDHFIGFDHLLRLCLGREKVLWLYGSDGFLKNIEGKFASYAWNLVNSYDHRLVIIATEIRTDCHIIKTYHCSRRFAADEPAKTQPATRIIWSEPAFEVETAILDHGLPCLGFSLKERFHINICKSGLDKLGLPSGPWLTEFKQALFTETADEQDFLPPPTRRDPKPKPVALKELAKAIAVITPGQKIAYITDAGFDNIEEITTLAKDADHLFIEAAFLDRHKEIAAEKKHLTARQAGFIARKAAVKRFSLFHFSPRYTDEGHLLEEEANRAFTESGDN